MAYSKQLIDHYENPRNVGSMDKQDPNVGTGLVGAPACGDVMKLQIKVNPETKVIEDAKFKTFGCGSAIASSSLITELVKGKATDEQQKLGILTLQQLWRYHQLRSIVLFLQKMLSKLRLKTMK